MAIPQFNSFECLPVSVSVSVTTVIAIVYRPPKSNDAFLSEFADLLSMLCLTFERSLILGDFNIHVDKNNLYKQRTF